MAEGGAPNQPLWEYPTYVDFSFMKKERRDDGMRLFFLTSLCMYQNVSLRRHYPHQVVGRNAQFPLSRLHRQLPILISNSLSTSIPLPYCNINIIFNIFAASSPLSIIYLSISEIIVMRNYVLIMSVGHSKSSRYDPQRCESNPLVQMKCMYI